MMKNEVIEVDGQKWIVREATSLDNALQAVANARVSGSVGSKLHEIRNGVETVLADVNRLNDDGTETKPYQH